MNIRITDNGHVAHAQVLKHRITERIPTDFGKGGFAISLAIDPSIGPDESYRIDCESGSATVTGACALGLYFGIGKLLHSARWGEADFVPCPTDGVVTHACPFRAMYFPVHFYNWYHMASMEEIRHYIEDMLLWGYNTILGILPVVNIVEWGDRLHVESVARLRGIYEAAKAYGMRVGTFLPVNQAIRSAPIEYSNDASFNLLMRGNSGRNLCMSKPAAVEYMRGVWRREIEVFDGIGLDYIVTWPYDEGGCGCEKCRPWGANKYLDSIIWLRDEVRRIYPSARFVVSTWAFDDPDDEGEYAGLYRRLSGDMAWVDYLMIDSHGAYPRFALENAPIKPIINFPEISMWGLIPWGGFGANPLPNRFQKIWNASRHLLSGGTPYTEGLYEDIMKIQWAGYYTDPDADWKTILSEYIAYECDAAVVNDVLEMLECIEINHVHIGENEEPELSYACRAAELARRADAKLGARAKAAWRWRVLYIRAILDEKRYRAFATAYPNDPKKIKRFSLFSGDLLVNDAEAQTMFAELQRLYHCVPANGQNHFTLPPLGGTAHKEEL